MILKQKYLGAANSYFPNILVFCFIGENMYKGKCIFITLLKLLKLFSKSLKKNLIIKNKFKIVKLNIKVDFE